MSHVAPWANRGERGRAWAAPPKEAAGRAPQATVLRHMKTNNSDNTYGHDGVTVQHRIMILFNITPGGRAQT